MMIFSKQLQELKEKAWPFWLTLLANLGINTTKNALAKRLPDNSPEEILTVNLASIMLNIVKFMSDEITDNAKQVREGLLKWLNEFMTPFVFNLFQPAVEKIKQAYNRAMVQYLKDTTEEIASLLTDSITPNNEQISEYLDGEFRKPETKDLVINQFAKGNLDNSGLDGDLVAFLTEALGIGWDALLGTDANALSVINVQELPDVKIVTLNMKNGMVATLTFAQAA